MMTIFIKTSDDKIFQANEICSISVPMPFSDGSTKREVRFKNKSEILISEEDYLELEKILRDSTVFYSLKKK